MQVSLDELSGAADTGIEGDGGRNPSSGGVIDASGGVGVPQVRLDRLDLHPGTSQISCNTGNLGLIGHHHQVVAVGGEQPSQLQTDAARSTRHHRQLPRAHGSVLPAGTQLKPRRRTDRQRVGDCLPAGGTSVVKE